MARPVSLQLALTILVGCGIALLAVRPASSQGIEYKGSKRCELCHSTDKNANGEISKWVTLRESDIWSKHDKHAKAYALLDSPRGKQMGLLLQHSLGWSDADVMTKKECLSCHANWHGKEHPTTKEIDDLRLKEGVSCESCHGPGSKYDTPHTEISWRTKTAAEKLEFGMIEVRHPVQRAQQCLKCHVGHAAEAKVVTHEMYAAGHPPLPSIEVETFANEMPPHWRALNEKPADLPEMDKIRELLNQRPDDLHGVKSVVVSSVANLRESIQYVATQAAGKGVVSPTWPDFAQFDCAMCHHELQTPSWRQTRLLLQKRGQPGRPMIPVWPAALVEVGIRRAAAGDASVVKSQTDQFYAKLKALHGVFLSSPFAIGQGAKIEAASQDLIAWLDQLADQLEKARYTPVEARATLADLCDIGSGPQPLDYDSARQIAWALRTVYWSLDGTPRKVDPTAELPSSRWTYWASQKENDAVGQKLAELTKRLRLDLPWTQGHSILAQNEQDEAFQAASQYNPAAFHEALKELRGKLQGVPEPAELQRTAQTPATATKVVEN